MARFAVGVVFGLVVGSTLGAALSIHAADEAGVGEDRQADSAKSAPEVESAEPAPTPEPAYGIWDQLAACESTSNWHIVSPPYYGGLQQDMTFWRRHGGLQFASRPDLASRAQQIAVAQRGLAVQGWAAWPACSRRLGLW